MKPLLTLILILGFSYSFAQVVYAKAVTTEYTRLFKKLPIPVQHEYDQPGKGSSAEDGMAIFTEFKCDTLNKAVRKKSQVAEPELIDLKTGKAVKSNPAKVGLPRLFCQATVRNDTLLIQISGLFLDRAIMHVVTQKQVSAFYFEHYKNDYILRENVNDSLTNGLQVPAKISRFVLSDSTYKTGDILYGSGEIVTNSYFKKDDWQDDHFYRLRWHFKYHFKCRIVKDDNQP